MKSENLLAVKEKNMKLFLSLVIAGMLTFGAGVAQAAETTNKVCTTDSYGNQTCSESSTTSSTTQEISYVSEVTNASSTNAESTNVEILNTSTPTVFQGLAIGSLVLGAAALVLKKKLNV